MKSIECLFLDIGGVVLTDGWNHHSRRRAAKHFRLSPLELQERHEQNFAVYEEGHMTLDEYLQRVIFHRKRSFTIEEFRQFMWAESQPFPEMLELVQDLKARLGLKIVVVSNEGRELNDHRIQRFGLDQFVDFFVSSAYVGMRKPDARIYQLALDLAQVKPEKVLYLENTELFLKVAAGFGIQSLWHRDYETTRRHLQHLHLIEKTARTHARKNRGAPHGSEKNTRA